jgi:hypothetical protein
MIVVYDEASTGVANRVVNLAPDGAVDGLDNGLR